MADDARAGDAAGRLTVPETRENGPCMRPVFFIWRKTGVTDVSKGLDWRFLDLARLPEDLLPRWPRCVPAKGRAVGTFDLARMARFSGFGVYAYARGRVWGLARGFSDGWQAGWLAELIVHRDAAGRGIGSTLGQAFIQRCGAGTIYCEALSGREAFLKAWDSKSGRV
ncbi:GNAT family N-acetyltransferase [Chromobacterium violaceum]|uniref:GNAT family N-acetyltransferase n=1 Tax=Chromobacterium violaceum TaxID=536 RepID=UPI001BE6AA0E|nr:GNAT family N-acetyltransferase [Chromobacterium violaceum]MBT2866680.1 GNAT family N-acetyltransferase [Chromobacterium violaceum]